MIVFLPAALVGVALTAQSPRTLHDLAQATQADHCWALLDDEKGSVQVAFQNLLAEDELVELGLRLRSVRASGMPDLARFLMAQGWRPGTWGLLDRQGRVLARGITADGLQPLLHAAASAGIQAPTKMLEAFLLKNPDHTQAFQALLVAHFQVATARMERFERFPPEDRRLQPGAGHGAEDRQRVTPLRPEDDAHIWGTCARLLVRLFREGKDAIGILPVAYSIPKSAQFSPIMGQAAVEVLPAIEAHLRQVPGDPVAWELWVRLNAVAPRKRSARSLLELMAPLPGRDSYLPANAAEAFTDEAKADRDWQAIVTVFGPIWEVAMDLPMMREPEGSEAARSVLDFAWRQTAPLLEARLRLNQEAEAEAVVRRLVAYTGQRGAGQLAAKLAASCGKPGLARTYSALEPPPEDRGRSTRMGK